MNNEKARGEVGKEKLAETTTFKLLVEIALCVHVCLGIFMQLSQMSSPCLIQ